MLASTALGPRGAPSVLLIHGWPLDRSIWADVLPPLASEGFRVVAPDLPGFGGSAGLRGRPTVEAYADAVADFLRSEASGPAAVAGHSFGGYVALALADRHPRRVAGLGLLASRTLADSETARRGREDAIAKVRAQGVAALLPGLAEKLLGPRAPAALRERATAIISAASPRAVVAGLRAMAARPDRTGLFASFAGPALVLHGAEDALIPLTEAATDPRSGPTAARILPDVGHMPMWEAPEETARWIAAWARGVHARA